MKLRLLISGSAVYLLSNAINAAVPFALLPILSRYLTPTEYGQVAIFQMLIAALTALVGFSIDASSSRKFFDEDSADIRYFLGSCFLLLAAASIAALVLLLLFKHLIAEFLGLTPLMVFAALLAASASMVIQVRLVHWQVRTQPYRYAVFQVSFTALGALLTLLLVVAKGGGVMGRIEAQTLATLGFAAVGTLLLYKDRLISFAQINRSYFHEILRFGLPLVPHMAGLFILSFIDRAIIAKQLGLSEAGIYTVALQIAGIYALIYQSINAAYAPWLFEQLKRDDEKLRRNLVLLTYAHFAISAAAGGIAFMAGPPFVRFIVGASYTESAEIVGLLALGYCFGGVYMMVSNYVFYSKKTGALAVATIISGLVNVALMIGLTTLYGLQGAAAGFASALAFRFVLTWWLANRCLPMPWFSVFKPPRSVTTTSV